MSRPSLNSNTPCSYATDKLHASHNPSGNGANGDCATADFMLTWHVKSSATTSSSKVNAIDLVR